MNKLNLEQLHVVQSKPRVSGHRIGKIVALHEDGAPVVDWRGNPLGAQRARIVSAMAARIATAHAQHSDVLLAFEEEDPARPLVVEVVIEAPPANETTAMEVNNPAPVAAAVKAQSTGAGEVTAKLATIAA